MYEQIKTDAFKCKSCGLCELGVVEGKQACVMGEGNLNSKILFIAQNPGNQEVLASQPLTHAGKSGKIYENVLKSLGLTRQDVYTCNVVLCHSPGNRALEPYEILKCRPFLERQFKLVNPQLVVSFGAPAAQALLYNFKITQDHGKIKYSDQFGVGVFPLYHPAYVGCYAKQSARDEFKQDLVVLKRLVQDKNLI